MPHNLKMCDCESNPSLGKPCCIVNYLPSPCHHSVLVFPVPFLSFSFSPSLTSFFLLDLQINTALISYFFMLFLFYAAVKSKSRLSLCRSLSGITMIAEERERQGGEM